MNRVLRRGFSGGLWKNIKELWKEAFPDEIDVADRLAQRKRQAALQREIDEKMMEGDYIVDEHIPEWKRGALVPIENSETGEDFLSHLKNKLVSTLGKNEDFNELVKEWENLKESTSEIKENITNRIVYSENVVVNKTVDLYDKIKTKLSPDVYIEMRRRYPDFEMEVFEEEVKHIFLEMYKHYLQHDLGYIEKVCAADAYATFSTLINTQKEQGLVHKYQEILHVQDFSIDSSMMTENKTPLFICTLKFYEIECLVDKLDPYKVVEGNLSWSTFRDFAFFLIPHPKPDIEATGHEWAVIRVEDRAKKLKLAGKTEQTEDNEKQ